MLVWTNTIAQVVSIGYALGLAIAVLLCIRNGWKLCAAAIGILLALQLNEFVFPIYMERWANAIAYGSDSSFKSVGELLALIGSVKYIVQSAAVMLLIYALFSQLRK